jgi:hypothetical protein
MIYRRDTVPSGLLGLLPLVGTLLLVPTLAAADNTTADSAYSLMIGGTPAEASLDSTATARWYLTAVRAGRSYCVETQAGVHFDSNAMAGTINATIHVWRSDRITPFAASSGTVFSDEGGGLYLSEPAGFGLPRACFVAPVTDEAYIQVERVYDWSAFNVRVRMVETTLFSNWFFVGGDYSAFTVIRNTTSGSGGYDHINYTITWRNSSGEVVGSRAGTLNADAGTYINARDILGALASISGTVEIAHDGSPEAIVASTTVMSGSTGLSFDAPFTQRRSW